MSYTRTTTRFQRIIIDTLRYNNYWTAVIQRPVGGYTRRVSDPDALIMLAQQAQPMVFSGSHKPATTVYINEQTLRVPGYAR